LCLPGFLCDTLSARFLGVFMSVRLTDEEIELVKDHLVELKLEHSDLDQLIGRLTHDKTVEELQVKRLKKRKLYVKDQISDLENELIPDILA
jgi:hypothetical protein